MFPSGYIPGMHRRSTAQDVWEYLVNTVTIDNAAGKILAMLPGYMARSVAATAPQALKGTELTLDYGSDYFAADNRAIALPITGSLPNWPNGSTFELDLTLNSVSVTLTGGTTSSLTGTPRTLYFDADRTALAVLGWGTDGEYKARMIRPNTHREVLISEGVLNINA